MQVQVSKSMGEWERKNKYILKFLRGQMTYEREREKLHPNVVLSLRKTKINRRKYIELPQILQNLISKREKWMSERFVINFNVPQWLIRSDKDLIIYVDSSMRIKKKEKFLV